MKKLYTRMKTNVAVHHLHRRPCKMWRMLTYSFSLFSSACSQQCQINPRQIPKVFAHTETSVETTKSQAPSASSRQEPLPKTYNLVFLGDSLTAGYELPAQESFPARVQQILQAQHARWKVVNAGVSGDTTAGGLARLDWVMRSQPDVLFVCLGGNDGLRGLKLAASEQNLREILAKSVKVTKKVALAGMRLPSNYGPEYTKNFAEFFPRLAKEFSIPYLPFLVDKVALVPELTLADGIHPNALGAQKVAENVYQFLKPILASVESADSGVESGALK